jgi:hypothetical protein
MVKKWLGIDSISTNEWTVDISLLALGGLACPFLMPPNWKPMATLAMLTSY